MAFDPEKKDWNGNPFLVFPNMGKDGNELRISRSKLAWDLKRLFWEEEQRDFIDNLLLNEAKREDNRHAMVADMMRRGRKWTIWDAVCEISAYYPELRAEDVPEIICRLNEAKLIIV